MNKIKTENKSSERPNQCLECLKSFSKKYHLKRHSVVHTKEKKFSCNKCGMKLGRKSSLNRHMKSHAGVKDHKCLKCGSLFTQKLGLERHAAVHTKEKKFSCIKCGKKFGWKKSLARHMKIHSVVIKLEHFESSRPFVPKFKTFKDHSVDYIKEKKFACLRCGVKFGISKTLWNHINSKVPCIKMEPV